MKTISAVGFLFVVLLNSIQTANGQSVLLMPEPLDGFVVSKAPIGSVEKPQGYLITVEKEGVIDKVQIIVEFRDLADPKARIAATKGYINGFSQSLVDAGLEVSDKSVPDITSESVQKRFTADVSFSQPDGSEILTRHIVFFGKHGYDARVIATSKDSLKELSSWASLIRPIDGNK